MSPLVSVVVPTYMRRDFLMGRALPSVLNQTVQDFEILVVGDGTDRGTVDAVTDLMRTEDRLRFWNLPHYEYPDDFMQRWGLVGLAAINHGIDKASGEWIAVLGDDDEFLPTHHEILLEAAARTGADHVYGISETYKDGRMTGQRYGAWPPGPGQLTNGSNLWRRDLGYRFALDCWDRDQTGDADMWIRMYEAGVKFHFEPQVVHSYHRSWP